MGKDNGIIRDGAKGGNWARVVNGALQVRVVAGGGTSILFPITPAQGGTGTSTVFTQGSVVFVGPAGVYAEDNPNFVYDDATNTLSVGILSASGNGYFGGVDSSFRLNVRKDSNNFLTMAVNNQDSGASAAAAIAFYSNTVAGQGAGIFLWSTAGASGRFDLVAENAAGLALRAAHASGLISFITAGGEVGRVNASGRFLLGTTTDDGSNRLQVSGGITGTAFTFTCGSAVNGPTQINYTTTVNGGSVLSISSGGSTTGTTYVVSCSVSSTVSAIFYVQQNGNGSAAFNATVVGTGDAVFQVATNGVTTWSIGLDNSDSDRFKIAAASSLGIGNDVLCIDPSTMTVGISDSGSAAPVAGFVLALTSTTGAFGVPTMTEAQRDALTGVNRMIIYNSTANKFQGYAGGVWVDFH